MSTQTALRATVSPHVNLLPPDIAEEARFRSLRVFMALVVVFGAFVGGVLYLQSVGEVTAAQDQLSSAQDEGTAMQTQLVKLANVPVVYAQVAAAEAQLNVAMGSEVRYSYVLNDLSLSINRNAWLSSVTVVQNPLAVTGTGVTPPAQGAAWTKPAIGKLSFAGTAKSYNDVAAWVDFLTADKFYSDAFISIANIGDKIGTASTVHFESTVNLTDKAYSHRFDTKAGK